MAISVKVPGQMSLVGKELITYTSRIDGGDDTTATIESAVRYPVTLREVQASNGAYQAGDITWTIDSASVLLAGITPKPGDSLADVDANSFTVLEAKRSQVAGFYALVTRNLAIAYNLRDSVDLQLPTITHDAALGRSESWSTSVSGIACKVQPIDTGAYTDRGIRASVTEYDVILPQDYTLTSGGNWGRFLWGSVYLEIERYEQPSRIDALPIAKCRKVP